MNPRKQYTEEKVFDSNELVRIYYHDETYVKTPIHTHNFYELNIVINGIGKHYLNKNVYNISNGDLFIIPPFIEHGYEFANDKYSIFHILFAKRFFEKYERFLNDLSGYKIMFDIDPMLRLQNKDTNFFLHVDMGSNFTLSRIFDELASLESESKENSQQKKEWLVLYIIAHICDQVEVYQNNLCSNDSYLFFIMKSIEYIHIHYGEKIELETLYDISCMSRSSFIRHFKHCFNGTPFDYIAQFRIDQAKVQLRETNRSIAQIAQDCGYCDSAHFIRSFNKSEKITPVKYRKQF